MFEEMSNNALKPIVFKTPKGFVYFDYSDIIMCSADGNCTIVFNLESNTPLRVLHNILFIERKYCNDTFLRCHKSHIINLMHIEKLITKTHQVQLKKNFVVPLSYRYWRRIRQMSEKKMKA
jgi:DNA-binding LytR/AlgR family response regulator